MIETALSAASAVPALPILATLVGLALVDATSTGTLVLPAVMLAQARVRPVAVLAYLVTIAVFYGAVGLLLLAGVGWGLENLSAQISPTTQTFLFALLGAALLALSFALEPATEAGRERRRRRRERSPGVLARAMSHVVGPNARCGAVIPLALLAGILELAMMVPYLAAIGIIADQGGSAPLRVALLVGYVLVMIVPALLLLGGRLVAARQVEPYLERLRAWAQRSGNSATAWAVGIIGGILLVQNGMRLVPMLGIGG